MNRSKNNVIASILIVLYSLQAIIRVAIALATQNQDAQDMGNGFLVVILILCTAALISAYGVWQDQKWGKILAIITLGVNALLALPGVIVAPTLLLKLDPASGVIVAILVTILLLYHPKQSVTV
ncbi:MAG: hypothetical protein ACK2UN_16145 [Candidatus Promineifilaceae bacterium]|jgi:hypothetical protein